MIRGGVGGVIDFYFLINNVIGFNICFCAASIYSAINMGPNATVVDVENIYTAIREIKDAIKTKASEEKLEDFRI